MPPTLQNVREYWDRRPCNVRHSRAPLGTRRYFDEVEARKYLVEPHIPGFAQFERWRDRSVLEIGCGIGTDTMRFARSGAAVTAVDLSPHSLSLARERARVYALEERIRFVEADAETLRRSLPPAPFDLVYSFGVLHHTPHPERALDELPHYCRRGTTLKLMLYHRYSWKVLWILLRHGRGRFRRVDELIARHSEAQEGCPVTFVYSRTRLRRELERRGFAIEEIRVDHVFPYRIADYIEGRYVRVWYFRWVPRPFFRLFERLLGWHLCVTATFVGGGTR